jgi:FkbM family methyltransferase
MHKIVSKKIKRKISKQVYKIWDATAYDQPHWVGKWYKAGGDEKFRYDYPLAKSSVVFDVGGYEGEFAQKIYDKYQCTVYVFEPVEAFAKNIEALFPKSNKKIHVYAYGLAGETRSEKMSVEEFTSSTFKESKNTKQVKLVDIIKFCEDNKIKHIDLIKVNIEGGEYELLERIIDTGFINKIDRIQVQFHDFVPMGEARMEKIQRALSKTHKPTYQFWFVWENWIKKDLKS